MVLRLLHRGLLVGGALYAGLVTTSAAQTVVPWVGTSEGNGGSQCSGPLRGMEFPSLAAAEAYTAALRCNFGAANNWCGPVQQFGDDWVVRQSGAYWKYRMVYGWSRNSDCSTIDGTMHYVVERLIALCPNWQDCEPSPCEQFAGYEIGMFYPGEQTQSRVCASPPPEEIHECAAVTVGAPFCNGGLCYGTLRFTGSACIDEPPVGDEAQTVVPPPNNNCITSGTVSVCFSKSDPNCGLVNGEPWCASGMPANGCVSTESGAVVCTVNAWSAPTEPDGVTPAEPDGVFVVGAEDGGRTYEYFRRETVASSGRPVVVGGPGTGGTGVQAPGEEDFQAELGELPTSRDRA